MFCKKCGYCLANLPSHRCPECGRDFDPAAQGSYRGKQRSRIMPWIWRATLLTLILTAALAGSWGWLWWGWRAETTAITAGHLIGDSRPIGSEWLRHLLGSRAYALDRIRKAYPRFGRDFDDTDARHLRHLAYLEELTGGQEEGGGG